MTKNTPIVSIPDNVVGYVKNMITRGELIPGDRLPSERQLSESLGVARMSLREAIKKLQCKGYVVVRRGKLGGTFISELSQPQAEWLSMMREQNEVLNDITALRVAIESHAAYLAAHNKMPSDLLVMEKAIQQQLDATHSSEFRLADSLFHEAIGKASGSVRLENAIREVRGEFFSPVDMFDFPKPIDEDNRQHQIIFDAIKVGDAEEARIAMRQHIENTSNEIFNLLYRG